MIDRAQIAKIADHAIGAYIGSDLIDVEAAKTEAVLATVGEFTPDEATGDEIDAELERLDEQYLARGTRQPAHHWLRESWAKERIAWRKHLEANSR